MADSVATRVARHRAKKHANGVTRLTIELDRETVGALRRLCKRHSKTQRQFIELAVQAADSLLAGRLQVARAAAQPGARVIIRSDSQKRPLAHDLTAGNTETSPHTESSPEASQQEPEQTADVDARIRSAAFVVEP